MTGPWRVTYNFLGFIGGDQEYAVYRLIDVEGVDRSDNREMGSEYVLTLDEAEELAAILNRQEAGNP